MGGRSFTVDDWLRLRQPTDRVPLHVSRDGARLTVSVQPTRREAAVRSLRGHSPAGVPFDAAGSRVLVVDTATGEVEAPFPAGSTSWGGQWSPDGRRLAAYVQQGEEPACLAIWERDSGAARRFPQAAVRPYFGFEVPRWTPDGQGVVVKLAPARPEAGQATGRPATTAAPAVRVFSFDPDVAAPAGAATPASGHVAAVSRGDLARVDAATGEVVRLAAGWSFRGWEVAPAGQAVAVLRLVAHDQTRQQDFFDLCVVPLTSGAAAAVAVLARNVPQESGICFSWSPDSRALAYLTQERGQPVRLFVVPAGGSSGSPAPLDLTAGEQMDLWWGDEAPRWGEDGRRIYYLAADGYGEFAADGSSRRRVRLDGEWEVRGWAQPVASPICWLPAASLSGPTSASASRGLERPSRGRAVPGPDEGRRTKDEEGFVVRPSSFVPHEDDSTAALGAAGAVRTPAATCTPGASGDSPLLVVRHKGTRHEGLALAEPEVESGRPIVLAEQAKRLTGWWHDSEVDQRGAAVYLLPQAAEHPAELWQFTIEGRPAGGTARRLLALNPALAEVTLGQSRLVEWTGGEGDRLGGAILLPPGYVEGQPVPMIVDVYGGARLSNLRHVFGGMEGVLHGQLLASRGYAVLYPDAPMTPRNPLRQLPGSVLPALSRLVELGIADPARLGLMGQSFGGYCVLALLTQTTRFRAAVAVAGAVNLTSHYGMLTEHGDSMFLGWGETGQGRLGGSLWERREAYIENSPLFYFDRVTTPLLLVSGTALAGEAGQAGEAFSALRRLGKRVELRLYEGEDHAPAFWSEASFRDYCGRVLDWFDAHLQP